MTDHAANVRRQLGELDELSKKTDAAERKILEAAQSQLEGVQRDLAKLRSRALVDDDAGQAYQDKLADRHRLQIVIAQAERNLSGR